LRKKEIGGLFTLLLTVNPQQYKLSNMTSLFCVVVIVYLFFLNRYLFKRKILFHPNIKLQLAISVIIGTLLMSLRFIPADIDKIIGIPIIAFLSNVSILSIEFLTFIFAPILLVYVVSDIFFIPKKHFKLLYLILVIVPFLVFWPKFGLNLSCKVVLPENNSIALWKGKQARFVINNTFNYPREYIIYDASSNEILEPNVSISELSQQNKCIGGKAGDLCFGVVIPKCEAPTDVSQFDHYNSNPTSTSIYK
jgi:hypothetical protein